MSDVLAVLQGTGKQVNALTPCGGGGVPGVPGEARGEEGGGSFTAVLFSRLHAGKGLAVAQRADPNIVLDAAGQDALKATDPKLVMAGVLAQGQMTAQALDLAKMAGGAQAAESAPWGASLKDKAAAHRIGLPTQQDPGSDAALQAALFAPALASPATAVNVVQAPAGAEEPALASTTDLAGRASQRHGSAMGAAAQAALAAKQAGRAAGDAAGGQLLPDGRGAGKPAMGAGEAEPKGRDAQLQVAADKPLPLVMQAQAQLTAVTAPLLKAGEGDLSAAAPLQSAQGGVAHGLPLISEAPSRASGVPVQVAVDAPLRSPQFAQELGDRMVWLAGRNGQMAEFALNPQHLGPLEVRLSMSGGEAGVQFFSPHQQVREAIEAALPRLREMLAESGVTLGQTQVREEAFSRQQSFAEGGPSGGAESGEVAGQSVPLPQAGLGGGRAGGLGLVDLYV